MFERFLVGGLEHFLFSIIYRIITSEVSRMKVFQNNMFLWFRYVSDMVCCYELYLAWFCSYDVDTVLDMILIWFQLWFLMWVKIVIWSQPIETISKIVSKPYQNCINIVWKPYQNCIKIISKPQKPSRNRPKRLSRGCFCFLSWSQPVGNPEKGAPFPHNPNDIYKKHNKTISKS